MPEYDPVLLCNMPCLPRQFLLYLGQRLQIQSIYNVPVVFVISPHKLFTPTVQWLVSCNYRKPQTKMPTYRHKAINDSSHCIIIISWGLKYWQHCSCCNRGIYQAANFVKSPQIGIFWSSEQNCLAMIQATSLIDAIFLSVVWFNQPGAGFTNDLSKDF